MTSNSRHRDVMQARDAGPHEQAADQHLTDGHLPPRYDDERDESREARMHECENCGGPVVLYSDR